MYHLSLRLKPATVHADHWSMTDDRRPNYDFFAPTPTPRPPPYPPAARTGPMPPQPGPTFVETIPPRRSGLPGWAVVLISAVAGLFVVGILAAIAIPVFISQREKAQWQATTVSLPATLNGADRNTTATANTLATTFANDGIPLENIGIYGPIGPDVVIIFAVKTPIAATPAQRAAERAEFERGFAVPGSSSLVLTPQADPGKLGGELSCDSSQGVQICVATDANSIFALVTGAKAVAPATLTRQAREATISRD
jgi:hypothetical protein